jgi:hypothetical protein
MGTGAPARHQDAGRTSLVTWVIFDRRPTYAANVRQETDSISPLSIVPQWISTTEPTPVLDPS